MLRIALLSPHESATSETFIQAHRRLLAGEVRLYHGRGDFMPTHLAGEGPLRSNRLPRVIFERLRRRALRSRLTLDELALRNSLRRERIDVVLAEYGPTGVVALPVCRSLRLPLLVHFHGFDASVHSIIESFRARYLELFEYASTVFVVSRLMERTLLDLGCPRAKLVYNVYGPDDRFFDVDCPQSAGTRLLSVGRFVEKKAPHLVVLSFQAVLGRHPQARLTMIGDGPLWTTCADMARHLGIAESIDFRGSVSPDEVRRCVQEADIFVQHSITGRDGDSEGTPVAILEAMAAARPIVATRHSGIEDVVVDGKVGFLVPEHAVGEMAERICWLLEEPQRALAMGSLAREHVRSNFSMKRHIGTLDAFVAAAVEEAT